MSLRTFGVFQFGSFRGNVRSANAENAFNNAGKKLPHIPKAELELVDPAVKRRGTEFYVPQSAVSIIKPCGKSCGITAVIIITPTIELTAPNFKFSCTL